MTLAHTGRNQDGEVVATRDARRADVVRRMPTGRPRRRRRERFDLGPALLFCPADRPERYAKALAARGRRDPRPRGRGGARATRRPRARRSSRIRSTPTATIVRVNPAGTDDFELDLDGPRSTDYRTVMLAKAASVRELDASPAST